MRSDPEGVMRFLRRLDDLLPGDETIELYLNGGAAVLIAYEGTLGTRDVDAIGSPEGALLTLSEQAGENSAIHSDTGLYLDVVPAGRFLSDDGWRLRARPVHKANLKRTRVYVMEVHDLVLSKIKRFHAKDRQDIEWLCLREDFDIDLLRTRYRSARQLLDYDEKEKADSHFNHIESAFLGLETTEF